MISAMYMHPTIIDKSPRIEICYTSSSGVYAWQARISMNTIILLYVETSLVIDITYNVYYYTYLYMYISIENRFGVNKLERKLIFSWNINKLKGTFFLLWRSMFLILLIQYGIQ